MAPATIGSPKEGIDFVSLPWNLNLPEEHDYVCIKTKDEWTKEHYDEEKDTGSLFSSLHSFSKQPLELTPATTSINYGTTVWEGLKCYRIADDKAVVFRADRNYERMLYGASELCLPMPSKKLFMRAIQLAVQKNSHIIPPFGDGMKLYVRPILLGTGQQRKSLEKSTAHVV